MSYDELHFLTDEYKKLLTERYGDFKNNSDIRVREATEMLINEEVNLVSWQKEVFDIFAKHCGRSAGKTFLINTLKKLDDEFFFEELNKATYDKHDDTLV